MVIRRKLRNGERGQILILCAVFLTVLLLFVGFAIDFGLAYVTKATLGKALDAAALTAAKYTALGQPQCTAIAKSSFFMNYGQSSRDTAPPVINVAYSSDSLGNTIMTITATSTIKTYFFGLVPTLRTLNVSSSAQARYARVEMTLILDRTGSMDTNAPGTSLPDAVTTFINYFDNTTDSVSLVSFANDATVDFGMQTGGFQTPIINAVKNINNGILNNGYQGATWSEGGLVKAQSQEAINLGLPGNIVHVVVFFTDGNANTVQDALNCTAGGNLKSGTWNFGGSDDTSQILFVTTDQNYYKNGTHCPSNLGSGDSAYPLNGNPKYACAAQKNTDNSACNGTFNSHLAGKQMDLNWTNVDGDAQYRAIAIANAMRAATPPTIIYAVGLKGPGGTLDMSFLCQVSNDPGSVCAQYFTYNPSTPTGMLAMASDYTQLATAFQTIASDIRLRLLQ